MDTLIKNSPPVMVYPLGHIYITDDTYICNLYFQDVDYYNITQNPFSNARIFNNKILIKGDNRDTTYNVTVQAVNQYGHSSTTMIVSEGAMFPSILKEFETKKLLENNTVSYKLDEYFEYAKYFRVVSDPFNSAIIDSRNYLNIAGNYRDVSYVVVVEASNSKGTVVLNIYVSEDVLPPGMAKPFIGVLDGEQEYVYLLSDYVKNASDYSILVNSPHLNTTIADGNKLVVVSASRNSEYTVIINASNVNHKGEVRVLKLNIILRENIEKPKVIKEFENTTLTKGEVIYDLEEYFIGNNISFKCTDPKSNTRISGNNLHIIANYRNTEYTIYITASNTNFLNDVNTVTTALNIIEDILPPFSKMMIEERIYMSNESIDFNMFQYFGGESIFFECATHVIQNGILRIQAQYRNTEYDIIVTARNTGSISSVLTIPISEDILPCTFVKTWGDTPITILNPSLEYDLTHYIQGEHVVYTLTNNPYSNANILNRILRIYGNYRNTSYEVVIRASNTNYMGNVYTVETVIKVSELIRKPYAKLEFEKIRLYGVIDVEYDLEDYFSGDSLQYSCTQPGIILGNTKLLLRPDYRDDEYFVIINADNEDYLGNTYRANSFVIVIESRRPPSLLRGGLEDLGTIQMTNNVIHILLSDYFQDVDTYTMDVNITRGGSFGQHGALIFYDILTVDADYRNTQYSIKSPVRMWMQLQVRKTPSRPFLIYLRFLKNQGFW